jgi:hypothetical protein
LAATFSFNVLAGGNRPAFSPVEMEVVLEAEAVEEEANAAGLVPRSKWELEVDLEMSEAIQSTTKKMQ